MKVKALLLGVAVVASVAGPSVAQAQVTMRMGARYSAMPVLRNPVARAELKLTPAQIKEIDAAMPKFEPGKPMRIAPGEMEAVEAKATKALNPAQRKRLDELVIQFHAPMIALRDDVAKKIGLTGEQRDRINEIQQTEFQKATQAAMNGGGVGRIRIGPEVMERVKAEAGKVLTPAQRQALQRLGGKSIKFK